MHHIIFDTNTLRNEHFNSPRMKILKKLIDENFARIYIPELVRREFLSQKEIDFKSKLKTSNIIDVDRFFVLDKELKNKLSMTESLIKEISIIIENSIYKEFDGWVKEYSIEILPFDNSKMTEVINNYFSGGTVFKNSKNRSDIPDAMICTSIEELLLKEDEINVLTNDKTFRNYLNKISGIKTFDSTTALLEKEEIVKDLHIIDRKIEKYDLIHSYLLSEIFKRKLFIYLKSESEIINDIYLEDDEITDTSILADSIFFCTLESANSSTLSDLIIKKVELADENEYFLYVSFTAKGSLHFGIEYYEYPKLENNKDRNVEYYNMKGDGATILKEYRLLEFHGTLSINIRSIDSIIPEELIEYDKIDIEIDEAIICN